MVPGCFICNNLIIYRYLNTTWRCPFCYLSAASHLVFESLVNFLKGHAMKTVVLGDYSARIITVLEDKPNAYGSPVQPNAHDVEKRFGSLSWGHPEYKRGDKGRCEISKPTVPRKTVSINHEVEFIEDYTSNKRKRKAMQKWPLMEVEDDEIKPLKSILKVGSKQI